MLICKRIYLKYSPKVTFDIELKHEIVVVNGDSGTGKTFFVTALQELKNDVLYNQDYSKKTNLSENDLKRIILLSDTELTRMGAEILAEGIKNSRGNLIIIDNADIILNSALCEYIAQDAYNQYLIYGRSGLKLDVLLDHYSIMQKNNGIYSLKYDEIERGWN